MQQFLFLVYLWTQEGSLTLLKQGDDVAMVRQAAEERKVMSHDIIMIMFHADNLLVLKVYRASGH
eukprot:4132872-Amphidinium_carterae.1